MKQEENLDLDVYLEPMIEINDGLTAQAQQPVIICVSNCGRPPKQAVA